MKKLYTQNKYKQQQQIKERRSFIKRSRLSKHYHLYEYDEFVKTRTSVKTKIKKLDAPYNFSLISNNNESLEFFDDFFRYIDNGYIKFHFNLRHVEELSIEVLLYIISLDKIYKEKVDLNLRISPPIKEELEYKIRVSGFTKYFTSTKVLVNTDAETVFDICDGATNRANNKDDGETCGEAVDFAKKFFDKSKHKDKVFRLLYESLAELMLNTDNHAYDLDENEDEDEIQFSKHDNWYLFAVKLEKGIAFYFFDNGRGITKTARGKIIDKAYGLIGLEQTNILKSVLKGEFRSKTGIGNRGKGLPQINELLTNESVELSVILTNKVYYSFTETNKIKYSKVKYDFRGSLFIWLLPYDVKENVNDNT